MQWMCQAHQSVVETRSASFHISGLDNVCNLFPCNASEFAKSCTVDWLHALHKTLCIAGCWFWYAYGSPFLFRDPWIILDCATSCKWLCCSCLCLIQMRSERWCAMALCEIMESSSSTMTSCCKSSLIHVCPVQSERGKGKCIIFALWHVTFKIVMRLGTVQVCTTTSCPSLRSSSQTKLSIASWCRILRMNWLMRLGSMKLWVLW